jgi:hypothetical protein
MTLKRFQQRVLDKTGIVYRGPTEKRPGGWLAMVEAWITGKV